ncbi:MAG: hypothetical protein JSS49_26685 [Planctomycetes bacterium]|nr:hypothetical protein [Planctomycetota bacterium]
MQRKLLLAIRRSQWRTALALSLRQNDVEVVTADHGIECLHVLSHFRPDTVVVEPELLWGGGDGVLAIIGENPQLDDVRTLVLTTDLNRSSLYSISQFRVSDFWVQPVSPQQVLTRILQLTPETQPPMAAEVQEAAGPPA